MEITERQIEVDGRTFTERVEVSYRQSDNGELVKTTTVHRTIAVGEKERRVIRFVHYFFVYYCRGEETFISLVMRLYKERLRLVKGLSLRHMKSMARLSFWKKINDLFTWTCNQTVTIPVSDQV